MRRGGTAPKGLDLGVPDMAAPTLDMAGAGALGSACVTDGDCHEGTSPTCFRQTPFDQSGKLEASRGHCSATCTVDADGDEGDCRTYTSEPHGWCFAPCTGPSDCRAGYACFAGTIASCLWSENLNCDPTSKSGTCADAPLSNPGGCIRSAVGPGLTRTCNDGCGLSGAACPNSKRPALGRHVPRRRLQRELLDQHRRPGVSLHAADR